MGCVLAAWAAGAVAATTQTPPAGPAGDAFHPARCKGGDRRFVYWAAGDQVFRFRFDPKLPLHARAPQDGRDGQRVMGIEHIPPAPDAREPEGCLRNPLRGGAVPYMREHAQDLFRRLAGRELDLRTPDRFLGHGYFALPDRLRADDRNALHADWFAKRTECIERAGGLRQCRDARASGPDDFKLAQVVRVPGKALVSGTPLPPQDLFVALQEDAATLVSPANGLAARSGIDLFGHVRLLNSWRLLPAEIELLAGFHRGLVRYIAQAHLPGYSWKTTQKGGKKP